MNKPNKVVVPHVPINVPWKGMFNFFTDINAQQGDTSALEALGMPTAKKPTNGCDDGGPPKTTIVYKKNNMYDVYFDIYELNSNYGINLTSFTLWLVSLSETDVVYFHQTGDIWDITSAIQAIGILQTACKAKKIFIVDHPYETPLFLLTADEVLFTEFGAITFTNNLSIDPDKWDLIFKPYVKSLYAKAIDRKYLTEDEVDAILNNNAIIFKTAKQLKEQGVLITTH